MSEFSDAKLIILPNEGAKAGTMYVVKPTDGTGDGVMDRNGEKTRVNKAGLIETLPANLLLPDYTDGGCGVIMPEPQATQLYELTNVMSTQTKTTTADNYVVSFYGLGTITFSGTHTGLLVGTGVNDRVQVTFLASAGSLISTVSGSVKTSQLQLGTVADSYIPNTGTGTVTRLKDNTSFPVPAGVTEIIETINDVEQTPITVIPVNYELPVFNLGVEEVVNGGFDTDLSGWLNSSSDTFEQVSSWEGSGGALHVVTSAANRGVRQTSVFTVSNHYVFKARIWIVSGGVFFGASTDKIGGGDYTTTGQWLDINEEYTPALDGTLRAYTTGSGEYYLDNISVKEVLSSGVNINKVIMN